MIFFYFLLLISLISFLIFTINEYKFIKNKYYLLLLALLTLFYCIVIAYRPITIPDTETYINRYYMMEWDDVLTFQVLSRNYLIGFEYGFMVLCLIFKTIGFTAEQFFLILYLLEFILFFKASNNLFKVEEHENTNYYTLALLFILIFGLYYQGIAIRSSISIVLLYYAFSILKQKKYLKTIILCLISILFHRTSVVFILGIIPIFLYKKKVSKKILLLLWIIMGITVFFNLFAIFWNVIAEIVNRIDAMFHLNYGIYFINVNNNIGGRIVLSRLLYWIIYGYSLFYYDEFDENTLPLINTVSIGCVLMIFIGSLTTSNRIYDYFIFYFIPLYHNILNKTTKDKRKLILIAFTILFFIMNIRIFE